MKFDKIKVFTAFDADKVRNRGSKQQGDNSRMNIFEKAEEMIEKHQCKKCSKCPCYWSDGFYLEQGCFIDEGRACQVLVPIFSKCFLFANFPGCFIPLFIIKLVDKFEWWQCKRKYREEQWGK